MVMYCMEKKAARYSCCFFDFKR